MSNSGGIFAGGAIFLGVVIVVGGFFLIFNRMRAHNQRLDLISVQAMGMVIFLAVVLVASAGGFIQGEALAALLGTVAGYVLGRSEKSEED